MSKSLRVNGLSLVLALGLLFGAGVAATASSMSAAEAPRKGCMQHNGSGNCDSCSPSCASDQVCCPIETEN
jgi:hypothetical protein